MIDPGQEICVAVMYKGASPYYHDKQVQRLAEDWPKLARAIAHLMHEQGQIPPQEWQRLG